MTFDNESDKRAPQSTRPAPSPQETLTDRGKRLRSWLTRGALAEGRVSVEVMRLASEWERHKAEADGLEIAEWLRKYVDARHDMSWYERRAEGHETTTSLGIERCLSSVAQVRWMALVPVSERAKSAIEIRDAWHEGGRVPLNPDQVSRVCKRFITKRKSRMWASEELRQLRERVKRMEAQIRGGCAPGTEPVK